MGAGVSSGFAESVLRRLKGDSSSVVETAFKSNDRESGINIHQDGVKYLIEMGNVDLNLVQWIWICVLMMMNRLQYYYSSWIQ